MGVHSFILLALCLCLTFMAATARKEPSSGHTYGDTCGSLDLAGVGIRKKGPIKVYSVALFADRAACAKECVDPSSDNMNWFCDSDSNKEIVLKMCRDVGTEKMASAIGDAIGSRMGGKDKAALNQLKGAMTAGFEKTGGAKAGTKLTFKSQKSKLSLHINGKQQTECSSSALVSAFYGTYTDKNCVSPSLKADFKKWLASN